MEHKQELWVGLFVSFALIVFILGISWGRGFSFLSKEKKIKVQFETVDGLQVGDPVVVRGINQGKVSSIQLQPHYAEILLSLNSEIVLYSDCQITIGISELMGSKQVFIDPGSNSVPFDWSQIQSGNLSNDLFSMVSTINNLVVRVDSLVVMLTSALQPDQIQTIQKNLELSTQDLQKMIRNNQTYLTNVSKRLDETTQLMVKDSLVSKTGMAIMRMDSTFKRLNYLLDQIDKDKGTLGKLVHDPKLYDHLLKTTKEADSLINDIKANPKRYIHVSVF